MFKPWTQYVWSKTGILFFFSRHAQLPLGLWLRALQCEWINILLRTPSIWFLLDRNSLCFSLHLAESVVREIKKTKPSVIVLFYLLLVASLRFSLVYLCVQFVYIFCGSPSFLGKMNKYINRSVVWRRFYSLLPFLLREQPWTLTSFCSSIGK